jgi:hypothetical protein
VPRAEISEEVSAMVKIWRYQNTDKLETQPSLCCYSKAHPLEPADGDGWDGYWWAELIYSALDPRSNELRERESEELYLVRAEDVERARDGHEVDVFVPGLFGCRDPLALHDYVQRCVGCVDGDAFVVVYEGIICDEYRVADESADVFIPKRIVRVYNARCWFDTIAFVVD